MAYRFHFPFPMLIKFCVKAIVIMKANLLTPCLSDFRPVFCFCTIAIRFQEIWKCNIYRDAITPLMISINAFSPININFYYVMNQTLVCLPLNSSFCSSNTSPWHIFHPFEYCQYVFYNLIHLLDNRLPLPENVW